MEAVSSGEAAGQRRGGRSRKVFPYYQWMAAEGIPVHSDVVGISDITAVPRAPWARTGCGLATFLELDGTFQAERGMFVCEIPPGEALDTQHHLYEQFTLILQGNGATEIWQKDGPRRTFEWTKGSLFAPPRNCYYRMFNLSQEPVLYFGVTNAPRLFNGLFGAYNAPVPPRQFECIFNCDCTFPEIWDGSADYFKPTERGQRDDGGERPGGFAPWAWHTNFIPDVNEMLVENLEAKVAGGQLSSYSMAGGFPTGHISEWPVGRYHKAHYHGPGAVLVGLKGKGYVNLWPKALGIHPWQDGHADQVMYVEWGPNSIYVPPDGWFHQHMSTGKVPARHVAVYGGTTPMASSSGDKGVYNSIREGGPLIDYEDEDPEVRRYFIEANRREGVECDMPPVTYRNDSIQLRDR